MKNKINIAELLKNCPKGMELDCIMYDDITLLGVDDSKFTIFPIRALRKDGTSIELTKYGQYVDADFAKCVIFPKGKTSWEGFVPPCQFKDGDIVATTNGLWIGITTGGKSGESIPTYCVTTGTDGFEAYFNYREKWKFQRLATEEEKEKLFDAIKANGYKWNEETKTLEKLVEPKFKVGDKIKHKDSGIYCTLREYSEGISAYRTNIGLSITCKDLEDWELVFNKFDITTFKPFDKVLMRSSNAREWVATFYSHYSNNKFYGCGMCCDQCIPYEKNEHLLGTTDDCNEYFKTW